MFAVRRDAYYVETAEQFSPAGLCLLELQKPISTPRARTTEPDKQNSLRN